MHPKRIKIVLLASKSNEIQEGSTFEISQELIDKANPYVKLE
jgi:hypothetical protein